MSRAIPPVTIDQFKKIKDIVHGFSPKTLMLEGGQAHPLNFSKKADSEILRHHLRLYLNSLHIDGDQAFLVDQVHGDKVHVLENLEDDYDSIEADAIITHLTDRPIAVLTADCIPIIVYDPEKHVVGVVHAGRKGTALGIFSKTISVLQENYASRPADLLVGVGPGICANCYEVDEQCLTAFQENYEGWQRFVRKTSQGKYLLDLFLANEVDGALCGVRPENIHRSGFCTSCHNDRFHSYRKEGATGRMMTVAMLRPPSWKYLVS